jgi:hypothetical protein
MPNYRTTLYHDHWLRLNEADGAVFVYRLDFHEHLKSVPGPRYGLTNAKSRVPYSIFQEHSLCGLGFARRLGIEVDDLTFTSVKITARKKPMSRKPEFTWQDVDACFVNIDGVRLEEISEFLRVAPFSCTRTKPQDNFRLLVAKTIPPAYICIGREFFEPRFHPVKGYRVRNVTVYQAVAKTSSLCDIPRHSSSPHVQTP